MTCEKAAIGVVHFYLDSSQLVMWEAIYQRNCNVWMDLNFSHVEPVLSKSLIIDNTFDILKYRYTRRTIHGETMMLWLIVLLFWMQSYINDITFCPFTLLEVWLHVDTLICSTLSQNAILPIMRNALPLCFIVDEL